MNKQIRGIGLIGCNVYQFPVQPKAVKRASSRFVDVAGYLGLALVQLNVLPAIWAAIQTGASAPILSILMMVVGLGLYLYNSVETGNKLYSIGNAIGFISNAALLMVVIVRGL